MDIGSNQSALLSWASPVRPYIQRETVYSKREIILPLTMGTGEVRKTVMMVFIVVNAHFSYNIILGRPTMNAIGLSSRLSSRWETKSAYRFGKRYVYDSLDFFGVDFNTSFDYHKPDKLSALDPKKSN